MLDTSQHVTYVYVLRLAKTTQPVATEPFSASVCFVLFLAYDCLQQGTKNAIQACQKILERLKTNCVVSSAACHTKYMLTAAKQMSRSEMHGAHCHLPVQVQPSGILATPHVKIVLSVRRWNWTSNVCSQPRQHHSAPHLPYNAPTAGSCADPLAWGSTSCT